MSKNQEIETDWGEVRRNLERSDPPPPAVVRWAMTLRRREAFEQWTREVAQARREAVEYGCAVCGWEVPPGLEYERYKNLDTHYHEQHPKQQVRA